MNRGQLAAVFLLSLLHQEIAGAGDIGSLATADGGEAPATAGNHDELGLLLDLVSKRDGAVSHRDFGLTERQAQVLALVAEGKPNKIICRELGLAVATVKIHVTAILRALGVANRTQAVIAVSRLGLRLPAAVNARRSLP